MQFTPFLFLTHSTQPVVVGVGGISISHFLPTFAHPKPNCEISTSMAAAFSFAQVLRFSSTPFSLQTNRNTLRSFTLFLPFSTASSSSSSYSVISPHKLQRKKWRQPVVSVLELGGVKIARDGNFSAFLMSIRPIAQI